MTFAGASIIGAITLGVVRLIELGGYGGVLVLMTLESAGAPIPSEIIMPFAGFLVAQGKLNFWLVVTMGTLGNLLGSLLLYYIGNVGGRPFLERYGKYFLLSKRELERSERWFKRYGGPIVFFGRLLPVVRTYISLPAGLSQMPLGQFGLYTFVGSAPWSVLFAWLGVRLGANWTVIESYFRQFDIAIVVAIVLLIGWWIWRQRKAKIRRVVEETIEEIQKPI
ncbi:DedA family protein [Candidatus Parcubacteria bacterium]|nr:DedA family protein [Candidatus Parcubacteria bacterium]